MHIVLGSASPYRKHALQQLGYTVTMRPANIDEQSIRHGDPLVLTLQLAKAKYQALKESLTENEVLLTADTVGFLNDGTILEKPRTPDEARTMIAQYQNGQAVHFATAVYVTTQHNTKSGVATATAWFNPIPSDLIEQTIHTGEALRCAGGFTLSNDKTWGYVKKLEGDKDTVVGFPSKLVLSLLQNI